MSRLTPDQFRTLLVNTVRNTPEYLLREARTKLGLTQGQLAKALGMSGARTVCKWENGERSIPPPVLILTTIWTDPDCPEKFKPRR